MFMAQITTNRHSEVQDTSIAEFNLHEDDRLFLAQWSAVSVHQSNTFQPLGTELLNPNSSL